MRDASPKIPMTPAEFVAWLNQPELEEGIDRNYFAEMIESMNLRLEDVPPGYRSREPREEWLKRRRLFEDWMLNATLGTFPFYFKRNSLQTPRYTWEPRSEIPGPERRRILIAREIVRLDEGGLLRAVRRCSVCDERRWFESHDPRKKWCSDSCRKKHHKDEQVLRERAARLRRALPSHWNDLDSRGYVYLYTTNCTGCERPVQWWRTPLRKTGRRGRPPATMIIPLESIQSTDGLRVRDHIHHLRLEELRREGERSKNVDYLLY
jgi:hypothetical protein